MSTAGPPRREQPTTKVRLDRDTIIAAALELASTPGMLSISFRDLGAHLGVDPTAVYRHFRNKEALMAALLEHLTESGLDRITADPADWRERLRELALNTLERFERFPAVGAEAIVITTHGPGEHRAIELILDAFSRAGLEGDDLVRHYALFASHVLSTSSNIARARAERGEAAVDGLWLDGPVLVDPREFPLIAQNSARLAELRDQDLFLAGVEMILDSAERAAARAG